MRFYLLTLGCPQIKQPGQLLIAAGRLAQHYGRDLTSQVPTLDGVIGTQHWTEIADFVNGLRHGGALYGGCPRAAADRPPRKATDEISQRLPKDHRGLQLPLCLLRHPHHQEALPQ